MFVQPLSLPRTGSFVSVTGGHLFGSPPTSPSPAPWLRKIQRALQTVCAPRDNTHALSAQAHTASRCSPATRATLEGPGGAGWGRRGAGHLLLAMPPLADPKSRRFWAASPMDQERPVLDTKYVLVIVSYLDSLSHHWNWGKIGLFCGLNGGEREREDIWKCLPRADPVLDPSAWARSAGTSSVSEAGVRGRPLGSRQVRENRMWPWVRTNGAAPSRFPGIPPSSTSLRPALSPFCFTTTGWRLRRLRELPEVTQQKDFEFEPRFTGTTWLSVMNWSVFPDLLCWSPSPPEPQIVTVFEIGP